jgi:hypothetical protein
MTRRFSLRFFHIFEIANIVIFFLEKKKEKTLMEKMENLFHLAITIKEMEFCFFLGFLLLGLKCMVSDIV